MHDSELQLTLIRGIALLIQHDKVLSITGPHQLISVLLLVVAHILEIETASLINDTIEMEVVEWQCPLILILIPITDCEPSTTTVKEDTLELLLHLLVNDLQLGSLLLQVGHLDDGRDHLPLDLLLQYSDYPASLVIGK